MVNIEDFIKRLENILEHYNLSASAFADAIGVQRSGLSHLLSGRNKPSLEFIMKIIAVYPEVDLYWLLNGKGKFPLDENSIASNGAPLPTPSVSTDDSIEKPVIKAETQRSVSAAANQVDEVKMMPGNLVEKIVIFNTNGTFDIYTPNKKPRDV